MKNLVKTESKGSASISDEAVKGLKEEVLRRMTAGGARGDEIHGMKLVIDELKKTGSERRLMWWKERDALDVAFAASLDSLVRVGVIKVWDLYYKGAEKAMHVLYSMLEKGELAALASKADEGKARISDATIAPDGGLQCDLPDPKEELKKRKQE